VRCLLDTHVLLWWLTDDRALSAGAGDLIADTANEVYVSAISIWEIAIKSQLGKITVDVDEVLAALAPAGLQPLSFGLDDAAEAGKLPPIHRDPFDRALVAQARCQGLRLLSADDRLAAYGEPVLRLASLG
jgi:PIN domain nuclease of toxin-antitoxin system